MYTHAYLGEIMYTHGAARSCTHTHIYIRDHVYIREVMYTYAYFAYEYVRSCIHTHIGNMCIYAYLGEIMYTYAYLGKIMHTYAYVYMRPCIPRRDHVYIRILCVCIHEFMYTYAYREHVYVRISRRDHVYVCISGTCIHRHI